MVWPLSVEEFPGRTIFGTIRSSRVVRDRIPAIRFFSDFVSRILRCRPRLPQSPRYYLLCLHWFRL